MKKDKENKLNKRWYSVNDIGEWIAEYTKDGEIEIDVWEWYKLWRKDFLRKTKSEKLK